MSPAGAGSPDITRLLRAWREGDRAALDELTPLIYEELRRRAAHQLRRERRGHTLQATALVHEAFIRLAGQHTPEWRDRAHFYAIASRVMRQVLVDHARARHAKKRGDGATRLSLDEALLISQDHNRGLVALDDALTELAAQDERKARLVEIRFFGGLSIEDTAEVLGLSPATVKRHWSFARAWLHKQITQY
jgi:RNA polymerase sigma factor (TIGR02999 family)